MISAENRPEPARFGQNGPQKLTFLREPLFTRQEVCAELGIAYRTFTRLRSQGEGPAVVWIGGRQMFTASEIKRWIRDYSERPGSPYSVFGNRRVSGAD